MPDPIISNTRTLIFLISFFLFPVAVCAQQTFPSGFNGNDAAADKHFAPDESDGCTMWFNGDFEDCCYRHDYAYRKSGLNWRTRLQADNRLFICIAEKRGIWHLPLASVMWTGVRIFGSDLLPLSSRNVIHKSFKRIFLSLRKQVRQSRRNLSHRTKGRKWLNFHLRKLDF